MTPQQVGQTVQCTQCHQAFTAGVPGAQVGYANPGAYAGGRASNGMAIASLVCGLVLCFAPISSILAIVFGIIGLSKTKDERYGGKGMSIAGIILGCLGFVFLGLSLLMLPALNRARETANRVVCAAHMRNIGSALIQYANTNNNVYPPNLNVLVQQGLMTQMDLECPSTGTPGHPGTPFVLAATAPMPANGVLVYEPVADHVNGANMLFGDGSVQFISPASHAQKMINDIQNGLNPPGP